MQKGMLQEKKAQGRRKAEVVIKVKMAKIIMRYRKYVVSPVLKIKA
jgi:hypothetical protein